MCYFYFDALKLKIKELKNKIISYFIHSSSFHSNQLQKKKKKKKTREWQKEHENDIWNVDLTQIKSNPIKSFFVITQREDRQKYLWRDEQRNQYNHNKTTTSLLKNETWKDEYLPILIVCLLSNDTYCQHQMIITIGEFQFFFPIKNPKKKKTDILRPRCNREILRNIFDWKKREKKK